MSYNPMTPEEAYNEILRLEKERNLLVIQYDKPLSVTTQKDKILMAKIDKIDTVLDMLFHTAYPEVQ